jgi:hypothetical protein
MGSAVLGAMIIEGATRETDFEHVLSIFSKIKSHHPHVPFLPVNSQSTMG